MPNAVEPMVIPGIDPPAMSIPVIGWAGAGAAGVSGAGAGGISIPAIGAAGAGASAGAEAGAVLMSIPGIGRGFGFGAGVGCEGARRGAGLAGGLDLAVGLGLAFGGAGIFIPGMPGIDCAAAGSGKAAAASNSINLVRSFMRRL
jgi:hypothetical protein